MKEVHFEEAPWARGTCRRKMDLRLATLLELGADAFGEDVGTLEKPKRGLHREGIFAFLGGDVTADGRESGLAQPFASVFVTAKSPDAMKRLAQAFPTGTALHRLGKTRVVTQAGNIATAEVAFADLAKLEDDEDVVAIEWTGAFRPAGREMAVAGPVFSARTVIGLDGAPDEIDGRGTLIGVIDVEGLDLYHPCFIGDEGTSRVVAMWDQRGEKSREVPSVPVAGGVTDVPYGRAYDRDALQREILASQFVPYSVVPHVAWKGSHGTKTAALAMGLGWDRPEARGIAPGAGLVFVGTFGSGVGALGSMAELADALAYVFAVADQENKPCVASISLGDDLGPRDGSSPVERYIEQLLDAPGRAVVIAAGNSAGRKHHARVPLEEGKTATLQIDVGARNTERCVVEIWYPALGDKGRVEVEVEAPGDGGRTACILPDERPRAFDADQTRALVASVAGVAGAEHNGLFRVEILSVNGTAPLLSGTWKVHLTVRAASGSEGAALAPREAHAWIDHRYIRFAGAEDKTTTLTSPATCRKSITVGAYDVLQKKPSWYSGRGPARDGRAKPDLLAPGGPLLVPSAMTAVRYVAENGTSLATPIVAGAVALVFQRHGKELAGGAVLSKLFAPGEPPEDPDLGRGVLDMGYFLAGST